MSHFDCDAARERLPWFVRGSLASDERAALDEHLDRCAACRAELADTRRALWIATRHLPADLLADYGAGLELAAWPRELVESHLAACSDCRDDLALDPFEVRSTRLESSPGPPRRAALAPFRPLALAASLLVALSIGWLGGRVAETRPSRANAGSPSEASDGAAAAPRLEPLPGPGAVGVALLELQPESLVRRGAEAEVPTLAGDLATTLVLATDRLPEAERYRIRALDAQSTQIATAEVVPSADGFLLLLVPPHAWPPGELRLVLEASGIGGWRTVDSFRLRAPG